MVHTLGCRLNQSESQMLRDRLASAGYLVVPFGQPADLGIINTCTVTREADSKCRKSIRQFIAQNPEAYTAVIGCYSQMGTAEIAGIPGVDLIVGNQDKFAVLEHIDQGKNERPVILRERISRADFTLSHVGDIPFDKRANLKVQDGCDFMCSFCIIPFARGQARSREWENTLDEARTAVARGIKELVLTGVNVGTYNNSGHGIVDLVDALNDIPGLLHVRISSIEPTTVPIDLLDRMADPKHNLLPFLHLPLQSGSDPVLALMRRKYSMNEYKAFVEEAIRRVPGLCLGTDIMVGFTGESEADFEETCKQFLELPFAYTHVFPFSEREGTLVMKREDGWVPMEERSRRCTRLRRLSSMKRHDFMEAHSGKEALVLLEDPRDGGFPGYTANYIRVRVGNPGHDIRNQLVRVRLGKIRADWMEAEILEFIN
ncbi:tRNA (N(6)-L-threonylcarbamoyladenosine(37)-C(2))-methylthiotransferase MtaB [Puniceicoccales bacterium CK1056]|uniref:tRNA (N(6)-L-threonylcarbamoyladenosine(37)-C(2))-methylthiotransferase MtaB n=2 Tax=Oceanipulchritudo coccoides TaxID=2706888 RepID=A0A6B2LZ02_9BACT|nr:tRNA (N(6)-L-threonylcarbamoyladenosine(37)-C(2))-methylthiotransferase MtaB [Oceanipulchritudo coccoides]